MSIVSLGYVCALINPIYPHITLYGYIINMICYYTHQYVFLFGIPPINGYYF